MTLSHLKVHAAVLFSLACLGAAIGAEKQGGTDQAKLQGKWQIISIALQGKVIKREDGLDGWKQVFDKEVVIQGDQFRHAQATGGKFQLDDTRAPKQITFPDQDGKLAFRGIYSLQGDTLTLCVNGNGKDARRPGEFATQANTPHVLLSLKKAPAGK